MKHAPEQLKMSKYILKQLKRSRYPYAAKRGIFEIKDNIGFPMSRK